MIYAGIGSRETPPEVLIVMEQIGAYLAGIGWTLRSGHADGADKAFESGSVAKNGKMEIFLPWDGFNGKCIDDSHHVPFITDELEAIAKAHHPRWDRLTNGAKKMHSRNVCQILGLSLDTPATMVICWTKDAKSGGGTGQAIRIAKTNGIPVYDLASASDRLRLQGKFIGLVVDKIEEGLFE